MIRALHGPATTEPTLYISVGGMTNLAVAPGTDLRVHARRRARHRVDGRRAGRASRAHPRARARLAQARRACSAPVDDIDGDPEIVVEARSVLSEGVAPDRRRGPQLTGLPHACRTAPAGVERAVLTGPAVAIPGFSGAARRAGSGCRSSWAWSPRPRRGLRRTSTPAAWRWPPGSTVEEVPA